MTMTRTPVTRLLVANRGEIARRIIRTCRRLGISTVAVYSHADRFAPYVREADLAMPLPGNTAAETYLRWQEGEIRASGPRTAANGA